MEREEGEKGDGKIKKKMTGKGYSDERSVDDRAGQDRQDREHD